MTEKRRFNGGGILLMMLLGILLYFVVSAARSAGDISYAQLRQLFEEEKVTEFTVIDTRLTASPPAISMISTFSTGI